MLALTSPTQRGFVVYRNKNPLDENSHTWAPLKVYKLVPRCVVKYLIMIADYSPLQLLSA